MSRHLSSEQLDEALHCELRGVAAEHLRECAACGLEVEAMRAAMGDLRTHTTLLVQKEWRKGALRERPRVPRMAWALAAAALVLSVGAPLAVKEFHRGPAVMVVAPVVPAMSDEALLDSVQDDLSNSVPEPLLPLAENTGSGTAGKSGSQRRTQ